MIRYLSLPEILDLHDRVISSSRGARGVRDLGALESAVNLPRQAFSGTELYPDLISKAAILCYTLVMNNPFLDANKRVGHASMETFLLLNGYELDAEIEEQETLMLDLAAGKLTKNEFTIWLKKHSRKASGYE